MYNLLEYSDNYQNSTGSLYQFKRDEPPNNNANVVNDTASKGCINQNLLKALIIIMLIM